MINPMSLEGKRVIITGASSGIGRAIAIFLSRLGAQVICSGRNLDRLNETYSQLEGNQHVIAPFDLQETEKIGKWFNSLVEEHGRSHGLVHSAGVQYTLPLQLQKPQKFEELIRTNTESALFLAKAFQKKSMKDKKGGAIVFISSVMGRVSLPGISVYSLSKSALEGLARSLALELAPRSIRVNCVAPAYTRTPMLDQLMKKWNENQVRQLIDRHPLGLGEMEDVANSVAFLLSDAARWITGTTLVVDGGYTAQ